MCGRRSSTRPTAVVAYAAEPFAPEGARNPTAWVGAVEAALERLDLTGVEAVAIDGTSGTLVAIDAHGDPLAEGSMYNDEAALDDRAEAARAAPAHASPTSPLARALGLRRRFKPAKILHQADFIASPPVRRGVHRREQCAEDRL